MFCQYVNFFLNFLILHEILQLSDIKTLKLPLKKEGGKLFILYNERLFFFFFTSYPPQGILFLSFYLSYFIYLFHLGQSHGQQHFEKTQHIEEEDSLPGQIFTRALLIFTHLLIVAG